RHPTTDCSTIPPVPQNSTSPVRNCLPMVHLPCTLVGSRPTLLMICNLRSPHRRWMRMTNSNVASSRLKSTVNALKSRCRIHCLASQRLSPNRSVVVRHAAPPEQAERVRLVFPETWLPHQC